MPYADDYRAARALDGEVSPAQECAEDIDRVLRNIAVDVERGDFWKHFQALIEKQFESAEPEVWNAVKDKILDTAAEFHSSFSDLCEEGA